jgi:hypothetical protein
MTNVAANVPSGSTTPENNNEKIPSGKGGWYARLSNEKKAECLKKLCVSCQQKKVAAALAVNVDEPESSLIGSVGPIHFKRYNKHITRR